MTCSPRTAWKVDGGRGRRVRVLAGAAHYDGGVCGQGEGGAGGGGLHCAQDTGWRRGSESATYAVTSIYKDLVISLRSLQTKYFTIVTTEYIFYHVVHI